MYGVPQVPNAVKKSNIVWMKPMFKLQTLLNADVQAVVDKFYEDHIRYTTRTCAVVSGDFQV